MDTLKDQMSKLLCSVRETSEKIFRIVKEIDAAAKREGGSGEEIAQITHLYDEKNYLLKQIKLLVEEKGIKDELRHNEEWKKCMEEIALIEGQNMKFLKQKTEETKDKLIELKKNKSLQKYNQKVEVSYENRVL